MARGLLSDRRELEVLFEELAEELARLSSSTEVVMVGGSWMLWHAHRASTRDVDSARRFQERLPARSRRQAPCRLHHRDRQRRRLGIDRRVAGARCLRC